MDGLTQSVERHGRGVVEGTAVASSHQREVRDCRAIGVSVGRVAVKLGSPFVHHGRTTTRAKVIDRSNPRAM